MNFEKGLKNSDYWTGLPKLLDYSESDYRGSTSSGLYHWRHQTSKQSDRKSLNTLYWFIFKVAQRLIQYLYFERKRGAPRPESTSHQGWPTGHFFGVSGHCSVLKSTKSTNELFQDIRLTTKPGRLPYLESGLVLNTSYENIDKLLWSDLLLAHSTPPPPYHRRQSESERWLVGCFTAF